MASAIGPVDVACLEHGERPTEIRMDSGADFIPQTLKTWASAVETVQASISPGQP